MGKLLSSHRSTTYPCFVPDLGDSAGAGRERLTRVKVNNNFLFTIYFAKFVNSPVQRQARLSGGAALSTQRFREHLFYEFIHCYPAVQRGRIPARTL
jgi:hypothetical protein